MVKKSVVNFPVILEIFIWLFYVSFYKYSYYLESAGLPRIPHNDLPYLQICIYAILTTLGLVPYYRYLVPRLLALKKYFWLFILTFVYFILVLPFFNDAVAWTFMKLTNGMVVNSFFVNAYEGYFLDWNLIMTDSIAFLCIAFSRFSFHNEYLRHKIETDHLQLQLSQLKTQLQPHFLFNTLNSLYGMSLTRSTETPRFILLLSQMMQYILYDCNSEEVLLANEIEFLKGYFEIEQKKFPGAKISLAVQDNLPELKIPPLLYLPLVENSFKHGRHKLEDNFGVEAFIKLEGNTLIFNIKNELLPDQPETNSNSRGGIGLSNIQKRLELYYPKKHKMIINRTTNEYEVNLNITL